LPCEPNGLSIHELAEGLLGRRDPVALGRVRRMLRGLSFLLGGLACRPGTDDFGHADVHLWGLPRDTYAVVRRLYEASKGRFPENGAGTDVDPDGLHV